jgi:hypothetical protein
MLNISSGERSIRLSVIRYLNEIFRKKKTQNRLENHKGARSKITVNDQVQCLIPIILATWEACIRRTTG